MEQKKHTTIDAYIADFPEEEAIILNKIRHCIQEAAPNAEEVISYNIPTFKLNKKILVHFAAFKNHIGFYALPSGNEAFQKELSQYKTGKGSIQFPLNEPIPFELISKMVKFRVVDVLTKVEDNRNKKTHETKF